MMLLPDSQKKSDDKYICLDAIPQHHWQIDGQTVRQNW